MNEAFELTGRVLVLCESRELLRAQLLGTARSLTLEAGGALRDRVSTDEITPLGLATTLTPRWLATAWSVWPEAA